jgi:hypothetical protein
MPIRKKSSRVPPIQMAKEYLQAYPSATNEQVVQALDISVRTVTSARAALIQMGLLPRSYFDRKNMTTVLTPPVIDGTNGPIPTPEGIAELGKAMETIGTSGGPGLTPIEMRERLSAVARRAAFEGAGQLEIAAIQAIAKLDAASGERDRLGPGVPLSRADKVARLSILMKICGSSIVDEALAISFRKEVDGLTTQENQAVTAERDTTADGPGVAERADQVLGQPAEPESGQTG